MCGIAGLIDVESPPSNESLTRMAAAMTCRGPDDEGILVKGSVGLAHRRLSIIDLEGGHQPILNEDESLAIVCNGEIYNFKELKDELQTKGHHFRTASDSEVILHLYEEENDYCLDRLNGMFAFAIADFEKGSLFIARDRLGQKPLFYAVSEDRFCFASGPAALARVPWVDSTLDFTAIHDYLEYQYIPRPRSIFRGMRKLAPGHSLRWEIGGNGSDISPYWSPALLPGYGGSLNDAAAEVEDRLRSSVSRRLMADVPLGAFLSGGMDSSIICALAQQSLQAAGAAPLKTFSIGFPIAKYDEREYAETVAGHLGTDHHFLEVNPAEFAHLERVVESFEEPFADAYMLPTWMLSQFTKNHVTVALSGDGADELFGGYYRYRVMHLSRLLVLAPRSLRAGIRKGLLAILPPKTEERTFWGRLRRLVELLDLDGLDRYLAIISRFPDALRRSIYTDTMLDAVKSHDGRHFLAAHCPEEGMMIDRIMELDCRTYMPEDILVKVDRASMAHGLEVRSPFLDPHVAEFALALPCHLKQKGRQRKRVLTQAFRDQLPPAIFTRPKMGFGLPVAHWLRSDWRQPVQDILFAGHLDDIIRRERLEWLMRQHIDRRADYSYGLFALTVLALWLEKNQGPC